MVISLNHFKMKNALNAFVDEWSGIADGMKERHVDYVRRNDDRMADVTLKGLSIANAMLYDIENIIDKSGDSDE